MGFVKFLGAIMRGEGIYHFPLLCFLILETIMKESDFQGKLIKEIEDRLPGCIVMKNDPNYIQGIPDLTILYKNKWAVLECKKSKNEKRRPNQEHYIRTMNEMSYASLVYPENKEEVLDAIQRALQPSRRTRVSKCK